MSQPRRGERVRETRETRITVSVDLDGSGAAAIATGVGFYDHLLSSLAHHSLIDIEVNAVGDTEVDDHHTVEDVALALGGAISDALGDRAGITRFGAARVPMDESLAQCALDLSGRPYAVIDLPFRADRMGELSTQMVEHALASFAQACGRHAAPRRPGAQRSPPRGSRVQGAGTRAAHGRRARPAPQRRRLHQGLAGARRGHRVSEPIRVAVVDYGAGNLVSIRNALLLLGAEVRVAEAPADLDAAEVILVPGVGASKPAMGRLRRQGLERPIIERVRGGTWFIGICLGLQLLFERSH